MKLSVAQTRPFRGDIERNVSNHIKAIELAWSIGCDTLIFPELSLTGYEPRLVKDLATHAGDRRLDEFQRRSDQYGITVCLGLPIARSGGVSICTVIFQPGVQRVAYAKKYLHPDEYEFFVPAEEFRGLLPNSNASLAICYEISIPEHADEAFNHGAEVYMASVAKSKDGVQKAVSRLADIATKYNFTVLMANSVGESEGFVSGGRSAIWNSKGVQVGQLNDVKEGILTIDTITQQVTISEWQ